MNCNNGCNKFDCRIPLIEDDNTIYEITAISSDPLPETLYVEVLEILDNRISSITPDNLKLQKIINFEVPYFPGLGSDIPQNKHALDSTQIMGLIRNVLVDSHGTYDEMGIREYNKLFQDIVEFESKKQNPKNVRYIVTGKLHTKLSDIIQEESHGNN